MSATLEILIKAAQNNDRKAQHSIYQQFSKRLYAICLRYCISTDEAQDCLQESFIIIFNKIKNFRNEGSFEGWIKRITVNTCLNKLKSKNTFTEYQDYKHNVVDDEEFDEDFYQMKIDEIYQLMKEMPQQYKTVLNLYTIEEYSHKEIAQQLNISEGTSKSNYSRAKEWLKSRLLHE